MYWTCVRYEAISHYFACPFQFLSSLVTGDVGMDVQHLGPKGINKMGNVCVMYWSRGGGSVQVSLLPPPVALPPPCPPPTPIHSSPLLSPPGCLLMVLSPSLLWTFIELPFRAKWEIWVICKLWLIPILQQIVFLFVKVITISERLLDLKPQQSWPQRKKQQSFVFSSSAFDSVEITWV